MEKYVVIVAGGNGTRMNAAVPKQFLFLGGKPVLYHCIKAFREAFPDIHVILVLPEAHMAAGQEIIDAFFGYEGIQLCTGGATRFHSVQQGLKLVPPQAIVFVQDAVRCLTSPALIHRCYEAVLEYGAVVPVISSKDSVRLLTESGNEAVDRRLVKLVQTPQVFHAQILLPAYAIDYKEQYTDEATVVEAFGVKVHLVEGEPENLKVTVPADLVVAEQLMKEREQPTASTTAKG